MVLRIPNEWRRRDDGAIEIMLTKDKVALVDECDLELVLAYRWHALASGRTQWYARSDTRLSRSKKIILLMHRLLLKTPPGTETEHRNGCGLDNRRGNLRFATHSQNQANRSKWKLDATSRFKGVFFHKSMSKWVASIRVNRRLIHLGYFDIEVKAALAYNEAAIKYFGEYARLNEVMKEGSENVKVNIK